MPAKLITRIETICFLMKLLEDRFEQSFTHPIAAGGPPEDIMRHAHNLYAVTTLYYHGRAYQDSTVREATEARLDGMAEALGNMETKLMIWQNE